MAIALSPPRYLSVAFALVAILIAGQVRAEDPAAPAAATGQKAGQGPRGAATPAAQPAAEQHKLPPDSTTKQSARSSRPQPCLHCDRRLDPPVRR